MFVKKVNNEYLTTPFYLAGRYIDPVTATIRFNRYKGHLRRKELEVIALLCSANGEPVARQAFIQHLWDNNTLLGEPGITRAIGDLRKTLQDYDKSNPIIVTLHRK